MKWGIVYKAHILAFQQKKLKSTTTLFWHVTQDCAEEIRNCPRESFCDLTSFFFFEILTKNSVWKSAFSTYVYITSRNWFSLKNNGKNEQLLQKTFISKSIFRDFLLVKLGSFTTRALLKNRLTKNVFTKSCSFFPLLLTEFFFRDHILFFSLVAECCGLLKNETFWTKKNSSYCRTLL